MITFINNIEHAKELSKLKIPQKVNEENIFGVFLKELIQRNDIENKAYDLITKSSPWWYSDLNIEGLDEEKIHSLIQNRVIRPTKKSFKSLKEHFDELNIELFEKHKSEFIKIIDELILDENDLENILKSTALNNLEKIKILEVCANETIMTNPENLKLIAQITLDDNSFEVKESLLKSLLQSNSVSIVHRIKIFNKNFYSVDDTFIEKFLKSLNSHYEKITNKNKKAKIEDNPDNRELLTNLKNKNYISSFSDGIFGLRVYHKRS